jgi:hypothetical protein
MIDFMLSLTHFCNYYHKKLTPVASRSEAWVCSRSLAGIVGSNPTGRHGYLSLLSVVCCQAESCVTCCSLVQGSPTECGVSECDREASTVRRP